MKEKNELKSLIANFSDHVIQTSEMYALRGGLMAGTGTNDEESGCGSDNRCDDCYSDPITVKL